MEIERIGLKVDNKCMNVDIIKIKRSLKEYCLSRNFKMDNVHVWEKLPWESLVQVLICLEWGELLTLMARNMEVRTQILEKYTPRHCWIKTQENLRYEGFKLIMRFFGKHFHKLTLNHMDIDKRTQTTACEHHTNLRYFKKIQKYCVNLKTLILVDIDIGCIEFKRNWRLFENLTSFQMNMTYFRSNEGFEQAMMHLINLEELVLRNLKLTPGYLKNFYSPNLKRLMLFTENVIHFHGYPQFYIELKRFFHRHIQIERLYINFPFEMPSGGSFDLPNLRQLTVAFHKGYNCQEWIFLKELPKLACLKIETDNFDHIFEVIKEIVTNTNLRTISIDEDYWIGRLNLKRIERNHKNMQTILEKTIHIEQIKLETFYKKFLTKFTDKRVYEPCSKEMLNTYDEI